MARKLKSNAFLTFFKGATPVESVTWYTRNFWCTQSNMIQTTTQFSEIVELIGRLWLYEVTPATLIAIRKASFAEPYSELGGFVPDSADSEVIEKLAIEYCQLLVGPKDHVSPVQSVWVDNQFQSNTAASMVRFFELIPGYRPESNLSDHIGVQLDFLSAVMRQEDQLAASEITNHFLNTHLQWALKFADKVEVHTKSDFYRGLARVTSNLIQTIADSDVQLTSASG